MIQILFQTSFINLGVEFILVLISIDKVKEITTPLQTHTNKYMVFYF